MTKASDLFKDLQKRAEEAEVQWEEIDEICGRIRKRLDMKDDKAYLDSIATSMEEDIASLLLLLVEQLRPLSSSKGQVKEMQDAMEVFNGLLTGGIPTK